MLQRHDRNSHRLGSSTHVRCVAACLLLSCLLGLPCAGARADTRQRKFGDAIGVGVKFAQGQPLDEIGMLTDLGVAWVRDTVRWADVEPAAGTFRSFPESFQRRLAFYREHDIGIVFLLAYGNEQAYPPTAQQPYRAVDPEAFARYAREVSRQLKRAKVRFVLEVWNEPHNFVLRRLLGGAWNGKPPSPWVDHYVRMVRAVVKQVRNVDPNITVLSDDDMWVIHYWFLEAGLPRELGGFAVHPYTKYGPEKTAVAADTPWTRPFTTVDPDRSLGSAIHRLRERGLAKLGSAPQIWITEWGWPVGGKGADGPLTEERVAAYVPRAFIVAFAAGASAVCWFSLQDRTDGKMGLTANGGNRRASYFALKTLSSELREFELVRQVAGADHPTSGVQAFLFRQGERHKLVLWTLGKAARVQLSGALRSARPTDKMGRPIVVVEDREGVAPAIALGESPVYLDRVRAGELSSDSLHALILSSSAEAVSKD